MNLLEKTRGATGARIIVGSAFFWAWLDALFMSLLFVRPEAEGLMAELAATSVFGLSLPWLALALARPAACNALLARKRAPLAFAALGTAGSLLFALAGASLNAAALAAGGLCAGAYMAASQLGWGATYCQDGERSATPFVAGGFACAILVDAPLLFMVPEAAAVFASLLPLASGALLATVPSEQRSYRRTPPPPPPNRDRVAVLTSLAPEGASRHVDEAPGPAGASASVRRLPRHDGVRLPAAPRVVLSDRG